MSKPRLLDAYDKKTGNIMSVYDNYATVREWSDGNPNNEDRLGYFVSIDTTSAGSTIVKANADSEVLGVTIASPGFSSNASPDKFNSNNTLLSNYANVGFIGIVPVIDNGTCTVNGNCIPSSDGTAIPTTESGYRVVDRVDDTHILILIVTGSSDSYRDKMLKTLEEVEMTSEEGYIPDVLAIQELDGKFGNCWISFTDEEGNPTDEPYIHWLEGYTSKGSYIQVVLALKQYIDELDEKLPFRLGVDENGNYGYYKNGADTVTSFGSGSSSWDSVTNKPFETLGDGLSVDENGVLSVIGGSNGITYSTEEQVIGTWIDGKQIYSIVTNEPINFYEYGNTTELTNDISNFEGHCSNCATIAEGNITLLAKDIGNNYIKIVTPINTNKKITFNRTKLEGSALKKLSYWIGSSVGSSDIDEVVIDSSSYFEDNYTDEIDLQKYNSKDKIYITINLYVVAGDNVKYQFNNIKIYEKVLNELYSFILKNNVKLGLKETGYKYYSEYTKSNYIGAPWSMPILSSDTQDINGVTYSVTADSYHNSMLPWLAFDGIDASTLATQGNSWHSSMATTYGTHWLMLTISKATRITSFTIKHRYTSNSLENHNLKEFIFEASNDGETWIELLNDTCVGSPATSETFKIVNTNYYTYYRIRELSTYSRLSYECYLVIGELIFEGLQSVNE